MWYGEMKLQQKDERENYTDVQSSLSNNSNKRTGDELKDTFKLWSECLDYREYIADS